MTPDEAGRERLLYWLALKLVPGLGVRNSQRLLNIFGHPERIFHSSQTELRAAVPRIPLATVEAIHSGIPFEDAANELRKTEAAGVAVIPYQDPRYPSRLKEVFDPPILLYALGRAELLQSDAFAVVGTRRPTAYGRQTAEKLTRDLVQAGLTHVSGMARGIDACSHRGALEAGGATIAVLGTGVDVLYPRDNRKIYEEIIEHGLVLSEFTMGQTPLAQNFPIRNRIISGMSMGVLVIEGAQYSGSLITARLALEQGREVLAVPGAITSKQSWGPNLLIKDGAKLVQEASDVIEELPLEVRERLAVEGRSRTVAQATASVGASAHQASLFEGQASPTGKKVLAQLRVDEAVQVDDIIRQLDGESPSDVLAALSELELFGAVKQLPGKSFVLSWSN